MSPEENEILKQAEADLFEQCQNLYSRSNSAMDEGATYAFILCKAKIGFLTSLITDVRYALSGHAPRVVVESVLLAVQHVEENFQNCLGTSEDK